MADERFTFAPATPETTGRFGFAEQEQPNLIKRFKEHVTAEPPPGDPRNNPVAGAIRTAGRLMLPESYLGAASIPLTAGVGRGFGAVAERVLPSLTKVAPAIGRVATTGAIGGAQAAMSGKDVPTAALLDVVLAAGAEGLGAGGAWMAGKRAAPLVKERAEALATNEGRKKGFEWATKSVDEAWEAIKARMPNAKVIVPSLSSAKISLEDAVQQLKTLSGPKYQQALAEIKSWMDRLDKQRLAGGPKPWAGREFTRRAAKERFVAPDVPAPKGTAFQRIAEAAQKGAQSNLARSVTDVAATAPVGDLGGMPAGLVALAMVPGAKWLARKVPGGSAVADMLDEAGE